jgi:Flp pilus assembly protein TadG
MKKMRGVVMVEFAIVGAVLLAVIFGCLEFGRATYTLAALDEGTRRAARLAAVCPVNDPVIAPAVNFAGLAGFNNTTGPGGNVNLQYLDVNGAVLTGVPAAGAVYYVRVGVAGYSIPLFIPGLNVTIASPTFTATLPAESMGLSVSGTNVVSTPC